MFSAGLVGKIVNAILEAGFEISALRMVTLTFFCNYLLHNILRRTWEAQLKVRAWSRCHMASLVWNCLAVFEKIFE